MNNLYKYILLVYYFV